MYFCFVKIDDVKYYFYKMILIFWIKIKGLDIILFNFYDDLIDFFKKLFLMIFSFLMFKKV